MVDDLRTRAVLCTFDVQFVPVVLPQVTSNFDSAQSMFYAFLVNSGSSSLVRTGLKRSIVSLCALPVPAFTSFMEK